MVRWVGYVIGEMVCVAFVASEQTAGRAAFSHFGGLMCITVYISLSVRIS